MSETLTATRISLEVACQSPMCSELAFPLHKQLSEGKYDLCSVLPLPASIDEWRAEHRTARKRADRCARLGYRFDEIARDKFNEDIYKINTSKETRQGRPMTKSYTEWQHYLPLPYYPCDRHAIRTYGVLHGRTLVAYLWLYRAGDLALVSSILGHGDHEWYDVMYLLVQGVIIDELHEPGFLVYNRHDSGTDGLRYFKERLGFTETAVEWAL